jgi:hypothetical protein
VLPGVVEHAARSALNAAPNNARDIKVVEPSNRQSQLSQCA